MSMKSAFFKLGLILQICFLAQFSFAESEVDATEITIHATRFGRDNAVGRHLMFCQSDEQDTARECLHFVPPMFFGDKIDLLYSVVKKDASKHWHTVHQFEGVTSDQATYKELFNFSWKVKISENCPVDFVVKIQKQTGELSLVSHEKAAYTCGMSTGN